MRLSRMLRINNHERRTMTVTYFWQQKTYRESLLYASRNMNVWCCARKSEVKWKSKTMFAIYIILFWLIQSQLTSRLHIMYRVKKNIHIHSSCTSWHDDHAAWRRAALRDLVREQGERQRHVRCAVWMRMCNGQFAVCPCTYLAHEARFERSPVAAAAVESVRVATWSRSKGCVWIFRCVRPLVLVRWLKCSANLCPAT